MEPEADDAPPPPRRRDEDHGHREGLPDPRNVTGETEFRSPAGRRYRILKTKERDVYDGSE